MRENFMNGKRRLNLLWFSLVLGTVTVSFAQTSPSPVPGNFVVRDFRFASGESLPELKIHYVTMGQPLKNKDGVVTNAILVLHGTGGNNKQFLGRGFAGVLFGKGQLLDTEKYFIVIPDNIGHGDSSKPSDGRRIQNTARTGPEHGHLYSHHDGQRTYANAKTNAKQGGGGFGV